MTTAAPTPDAPASPIAGPESPAESPDVPACASCGAGMERHQDWCLECGTAAPGRLGGARPGWRAVATTLGLTLVLVGGAGAASYAALSSDANREVIAQAQTPAAGGPIAVAPPAVPAPAAPVIPPKPPKAPKVTVPEATLPTAPEVTPVDPGTVAQVTPPPTPSPEKPRVSTPRADDGEDGKAPPRAAPKPIALGAGAVSLFDPSTRAVEPGDPARAHDGSLTTSFAFGAPDDGQPLRVGVIVDLLKLRRVRAVEVTLKSPGGAIELYGTDSSTPPPDLSDTRWEPLPGRTATARKERIVLDRDGSDYRYVTLWFTTPPPAGPKVAVVELDVLA